MSRFIGGLIIFGQDVSNELNPSKSSYFQQMKVKLNRKSRKIPLFRMSFHFQPTRHDFSKRGF